jgi:Cysteine dioxygenase type I
MPTSHRWVAPTPLSIRELVELTGEIAAEVEAGDHEVRFDPVRRWHTRLRAGAYADIWLISWPRHQAAELHDHGGSIGALTVVRGALTEHRWLPSGSLVPRLLRTGSHAGFPVGYVHDVVNLEPAPALSVHAYSPPLTAMSYYEVDDNRALRRIRTLLTDDPEPAVATAESVA